MYRHKSFKNRACSIIKMIPKHILLAKTKALFHRHNAGFLFQSFALLGNKKALTAKKAPIDSLVLFIYKRNPVYIR